MTPDAIRTALENAKGVPTAALAEAVTHAGDLAPVVIGLAEKVGQGVHLLPRQAKLLFFGLHALAAAGQTSACPALLALLRRPEYQLDNLLGDALTESCPGLLLALYDGNVDPLYAALEQPDVGQTIKWMLFRVLARLAWDGRTPRDRFIAFLDRFERDALAPPEHSAWEGWQNAIMYLGLKEFEDRVRRGWEQGRGVFQNEPDHRDWLERLEYAAAHPDDPQLFLDDHVVAITDPVESLKWMTVSPRETGEVRKGADDPAAAIKLSEDELDWLAGFLVSDHAPQTAMDLEALDGFYSALFAGPQLVPPAEYLGELWGSRGERPRYDNAEQARLVTTLLTRHRDTVAARLEAGFSHPPLLLDRRPERKGRAWASGFLRGVLMCTDAWRPLVRDPQAGQLFRSILELVADEFGWRNEPIAPDVRGTILKTLPLTLVAFHDFWRQAAPGLPAAAPARSTQEGTLRPAH